MARGGVYGALLAARCSAPFVARVARTGSEGAARVCVRSAGAAHTGGLGCHGLTRAETALAWEQGASCRVPVPKGKLRMKLLWQAKMVTRTLCLLPRLLWWGIFSRFLWACFGLSLGVNGAIRSHTCELKLLHSALYAFPLRVSSSLSDTYFLALAFGVSGADPCQGRKTLKEKEPMVWVNRAALLRPSGSLTQTSSLAGAVEIRGTQAHVFLEVARCVAFSALARRFYGNKNFPPTAPLLTFWVPKQVRREKDTGSI